MLMKKLLTNDYWHPIPSEDFLLTTLIYPESLKLVCVRFRGWNTSAFVETRIVAVNLH
jgi:hypothetical protein